MGRAHVIVLRGIQGKPEVIINQKPGQRFTL